MPPGARCRSGRRNEAKTHRFVESPGRTPFAKDVFDGMLPAKSPELGAWLRRIPASILDETKLRREFAKVLGENEFLRPDGNRSLSRFHAELPHVFVAGGGSAACPNCRPRPTRARSAATRNGAEPRRRRSTRS